jgi:hypothetical protein
MTDTNIPNELPYTEERQFREEVAEHLAPPSTPPTDTPRDAEKIAQRFHEAYERLAPSFGYTTREASAGAWENVPEQNRKLMIAVCAELFPAPTDTPKESAEFHTAVVEAMKVLQGGNQAPPDTPELEDLLDELGRESYNYGFSKAEGRSPQVAKHFASAAAARSALREEYVRLRRDTEARVYREHQDEIYRHVDARKSALDLVASLRAEVERHRELAKELGRLSDYDWDDVLDVIPDHWAQKDIFERLRRISGYTSGGEK